LGADAHGEHLWSLLGFIYCAILFIAYLVYQVKYADVSQTIDDATRTAIANGICSLSGAFALELREIAEASVCSYRGIAPGMLCQRINQLPFSDTRKGHRFSNLAPRTNVSMIL
jgi:hypothetical protein